jgi:hypothetical protein
MSNNLHEEKPSSEAGDLSSPFCQPVNNNNPDNGDDNNNNDDNSNSNSSPKKKQKVQCSIENCKNNAQLGGICVKHGGKYVYQCTISGCNRQQKKGGYCKAHGKDAGVTQKARPICQIEGCTNLETNKGVCIRHGAKVKSCSVNECPNQALKGGVCWTHGAKFLKKPRKKCSIDNCNKLAQKGGKCVAHYREGGATTCIVVGCSNEITGTGEKCNVHCLPQYSSHAASPSLSGGATATATATAATATAKTPTKKQTPQKHQPVRVCSISGCKTHSKKHGYCRRHYNLVWKCKMEVHIHIIAPPGELGLVIHVDDDPMKGGYIPIKKRQLDLSTEGTGGSSGGGGGGATITGIDPKCSLFGQVEVGDRIITIDDQIISSNADFHINTNQTRKLGISKHTTLLAKIRTEEEQLGETLKYTLSGLEIAKMHTQIQQLGKLHDEALSKISVLNEKLERASAKETALEAQLREAKVKMKELNQENVSLKATLVREKRSWEKQQRDEEKKRKEEEKQKRMMKKKEKCPHCGTVCVESRLCCSKRSLPNDDE